MQSKYMTHQNTQCEGVTGIGKPNVQNEAFFYPELLQSNESKKNLHWDLWQLWFLQQFFSRKRICLSHLYHLESSVRSASSKASQ